MQKTKFILRIAIILCFAFLMIYSVSNSRAKNGLNNNVEPQQPSGGQNAAQSLVLSRSNPYANNNGQMPATPYTDPTFHLSYNYPQTLPPIEPALKAISEKYTSLTQDNAEAYMLDLRKYVYDALLPVDWYADQITDKERGWYNSPWLGEANYLTGWPGREFIRGMYLGSIQTKTQLLSPTQTDPYYSYSIEIYNNRGGYIVGQIWKDIKNANFNASQYPEGTVVVKLNTTTASLEQVPELKGSVEWQLFITSPIYGPGIVLPELTPVHHMQIDIIVRDSKLSPKVGWVYTSFVYDQNAKGTGWEKMVPSGLMFGNDPGITPADVKAGKKLQETIIASTNPSLAVKTLGWAGRLSGPADNGENSSCLSCHGTAQWQPIAPLIPPSTLTPTERLPWFVNNPGNVPFTAGQIATDYDWVIINAAMNAMATNGVLGTTTQNSYLKYRRSRRY